MDTKERVLELQMVKDLISTIDLVNNDEFETLLITMDKDLAVKVVEQIEKNLNVCVNFSKENASNNPEIEAYVLLMNELKKFNKNIRKSINELKKRILEY